ncbi:MAG: NAD-dependent epimerase/dehydratase family protein [Methylobacter sp.]
MNKNLGLPDVEVIAVIGASGFVGRHLVAFLSARKNVEIRVLVHHRKLKAGDKPNIVFIEGNLLEPETLIPLFESGCTVINLAYLATHRFQDNIDAMVNLAEACAARKVKRLIHCSTAVVAGNIPEKVIVETTLCSPASEYQRSKLAIEKVLLARAQGRFELSILRPSAVFGPEGKNLIKLAGELCAGNKLKSYAKSCFFGRRSMNLVCVENVVAALIFLLDTDNKIDREVFIISDDDVPINNYRDIEKRLIKNLEIEPFQFPVVRLPMWLLATVLRLAKKPQSNPVVKYSDQKLTKLGFKKPMKLETGIDAFSRWYKNK